MAPAALPGRGLAQHQFFYAGEQKTAPDVVVKHGRVVWSYIDANSKGEISDAVMLSNGNILFAHQYAVTLITSDKKVLWNFDAPQGTEIHTAQPIGKERVIFIQNGDPALLRVVNITTGKTELEFTLPTGTRRASTALPACPVDACRDHSRGAHGHEESRGVRRQGQGSLVLCGGQPRSAERLGNGNTLITTNKKLVLEVDPKGTVVWQLTPEDMPGLSDSRLPDRHATAERQHAGQQLGESVEHYGGQAERPRPGDGVHARQTIVWVLRSWDDPADLGPARRSNCWTSPSQRKTFTSATSGRRAIAIRRPAAVPRRVSPGRP